MIYVDRNEVPPPTGFEKKARLERDKAEKFFTSEKARTGHDRFEYRSFRSSEARDALLKLFHGKCAFCESPIQATGSIDIDHFRPKGGCVDQEGNHFPLHYWWLATEWSNIYPACPRCNRTKGNRFPILGERASTEERETNSESLYRLEEPLLLDPCFEIENPERHLVYSDEGEVSSSTEMGRTSIELYALNRKELVAARKDRLLVLLDCIEQMDRLFPTSPSDKEEAVLGQLLAQIGVMSNSASPYAGMCRQFTRRLIGDRGYAEDTFSENVSRTELVSQVEQKQTTAEFIEFQTANNEFTVASDEPSKKYYKKRHTIEKIVIRNFRPITELTLELNGQEEVPWLMLLGENGSGKSSVLKAIALALMGESYRDSPSLQLSPMDYLRRDEATGYVHIYLTGMNNPIELNLDSESTRFRGGEAPKVLLLGYGSTRLLPRNGGQHYGTTYARIDNLFNPFAPLADARKWLLELSPHDFEEVKPDLKQLLNLDVSDDIMQRQELEIIEVTLHGDTVPLEQLSDGYQTVIALAAEIMSILRDKWSSMASAEGIVLLDEVGSHLHPSWKMKIVSSLRDTFPLVQFILSSHDPLCLRGMKKGEVVVMERNVEGRIIATDDLPNPEAMRVDQILQSDYFNLASTVDDSTNDLYEEYYKLLSIKPRSSEEEDRIEYVRQLLREMRVFGDSDRERMMLEVIDEYRVEREKEENKVEREKLKENTRNQLKEAWDSARRAEMSGFDNEDESAT